ncbi:signal peptidase I [Vagococcus hydrophili]|uniref:Signal peptidase I n=2 Tax=Vagococcus hydrophili TaxID=2714947 RepID=A0A6G8AXT4_9ENTE|nr:signal peptidase I [Vagococcus hydrophili]
MLSIFIGAGLMAIMQKQDKSLNGYRMFGVLTDSMVSPGNKIKEGGFRSGDIIIIKEVKAKDLKKGDVITYRPSTNPDNKNNNYLTHRVVKVQNDYKGREGYYFTTRGDANKTDDMPMSEKALVGKVVGRIPKVGGILAFIKENFVLSLIFILSVVGFFWVIRMYILASDDDEEEEKKPRKEVKEVSKKKSSKSSKSKKSSKHSKEKTHSSKSSKSKSHSHKSKSGKSKKSKTKK